MFKGDVHDPMSQRAYMWNNNDGDGGFTEEAMNDALQNGKSIEQKNGNIMHVGANAVIVTYKENRVVTGWARSNQGRLIKKKER